MHLFSQNVSFELLANLQNVVGVICIKLMRMSWCGLSYEMVNKETVFIRSHSAEKMNAS